MRAFLKVIALVLCISLILPICSLMSFAAFPGEPTLSIIKMPDRVDYYEGTDWYYDSNGTILTYKDLDIRGTIIGFEGMEVPYYVFPWGPNMFCAARSNRWKVGANDACIIIDDVDDEYAPITVYFHTIKKVSVAEAPTVTHYIRGSDWYYDKYGNIAIYDLYLDGIKLKAEYSDGTTGYITKKDAFIDWIVVDDYFQYKLGCNTVYALFNKQPLPFEIYIELDEITSVSLGSLPKKSTFDFNKDWFMVRGKPRAELDLSGMTITTKYNNNTTETVRYDDCPEKFEIIPGQNLKPGFNQIRMIYDSKFEFTANFSLLMMGDIDFDGMINSTDALLVLRSTVGTVELNDRQTIYADVNDDGIINSADALCIQRRCVGLITAFDAEL
ncbi:MAG: dockerin type I repeat-containing protein [Clostridia bacterium]|nr:dockerin type I repeat-containing protein [Clostridia bacterium]